MKYRGGEMILYLRCCVIVADINAPTATRYLGFFFVTGWNWEKFFDEMSVNYGLAITVS